MFELSPERSNSLAATRPVVLRDVNGSDRVLSKEALGFLADLERYFGATLRQLLANRTRRQARYDAGEKPDFLEETAHIRQSDWKAGVIPQNLQDRRVEITGPVDRKMMINAFNSGARVFMADFEDASAPTFKNMIQGQINLLDYTEGALSHYDDKNERDYQLNDQTAVLIVRPRGLHLKERHVLIDGGPITAAFFDFGLHIFHNGSALSCSGRGPYYYLPKLEDHNEAKLWNDIFLFSEKRLALAPGTIKATVLIETLPAAFQMDEIIWQLREYIVGLNCGRWDYIFSYIKTLRAHRDHILPDRGQVTMDQKFLSAYSAKLIEVCHRRGIHAMGGMAAHIPVKNDDEKNNAAIVQIKTDKLREVTAGHDGTWVAHPDLVSVAMDVFDTEMPLAHQISKPRMSARVTHKSMLAPHEGQISETGLRNNISVVIEYMAAWLCGKGAVPINNLMEDLATAEICRAQVWQWLHHNVDIITQDGEIRQLDQDRFRALLQKEITNIIENLGVGRFHRGHYASAIWLFEQSIVSDTLPDFITHNAYDLLCALD